MVESPQAGYLAGRLRKAQKKPVREKRGQIDFLGGMQRGESSESSLQIGDLRPLPDATGASAAGEMGR